MPDIPSHLLRTPSDHAALAEGCAYDPAAAERVRTFFRKFLRHSKGQWAGKPFELLDWQWTDLIQPLFGWKRPDGTRRFRRAYIEIPKKNGKSTIAAGVGLYLLVGDGEPGAEIYSLAADQAQASIVHGEAVSMAKASSGLSSYLKINHTTRNIAFPKTGSWYRALSSEAETKEGLNAHGLIVDELHAWRGRALWDTIRYASRSRRQPLLFVITTAGDNPLSVCREQHDYARQVLSGAVVDTRFFPYIRAARQVAEGDAEDDDWTVPETWHRANPSLGVTIDEKEFAADCQEAQRSPTGAAAFKRYSLNIWSTSTNPWLRLEDWMRCREEFTEASLTGLPCWGGLDLASTQDLTAFVLCFRRDQQYLLLPFFWLPEDRARDPDAPEQYRVWAQQGHLRTTPGNVCDYRFVVRDVAAICQRTGCQEFRYDPWNAEQATQELEEQHGVKRVAFAQTVTNFAEPAKEFERMVAAGEIRHNGHPVMTWMVGHCNIRTDPNGNRRPVKPPHGDARKIDGVVAALEALAGALANPDQGAPTITWI